jgi:hypothetical protein
MDYEAITRVKAALKDEDVPDDLSSPNVGRLFGKSALLSLGVLVSMFITMAFVDEAAATIIAILMLTLIFLILVATALTSLLLLIVDNLRRLGRLLASRPRRVDLCADSLADDWLDGPGA